MSSLVYTLRSSLGRRAAHPAQEPPATPFPAHSTAAGSRALLHFKDLHNHPPPNSFLNEGPFGTFSPTPQSPPHNSSGPQLCGCSSRPLAGDLAAGQ